MASQQQDDGQAGGESGCAHHVHKFAADPKVKHAVNCKQKRCSFVHTRHVLKCLPYLLVRDWRACMQCPPGTRRKLCMGPAKHHASWPASGVAATHQACIACMHADC